MKTLLIVFHSQTGNTRRMAEASAAGASRVAGVKVLLKPAPQATLSDLLACDALAIGSPEYFGYMAGLVKDFLDRTYEHARGRREVLRKPYAIFISAGNDGRGALNAIQRICSGYPFKLVFEPLIARGTVDESVLVRCREMGQTLAAGCEAGIY